MASESRIFNVLKVNRVFSVQALAQELPVNQIYHFTKDPAAIEDFTIRWTAWLNGDTVISSVWSVPAGIVKTTETLLPTGTAVNATIWLASGTVGQIYEIPNRIITAAGRQDERTISILVENK